MRRKIKHIIPFFFVISLLIVGDSSNSRFNFHDYYRTTEYVEKNKSSVNHCRTYHYRKFYCERSNFQYFVFSLEKFQAHYNQQIEDIIKTQAILYLKIKKLEQIYPKWNNLKYSFVAYPDLYRRGIFMTRFSLTSNLLHVLTSNMSNHLSFRKCINQIRINSIFQFIKSFLNRLKTIIYLIVIASMLGLSNALYDETRMINNTKSGYEQEQIIDDEEPKE